MKARDQQPLLFVLSVDTEEQWDWSGPFPQQDFNVSNVRKLPEFQKICDELGIKPSYFVDYAVAGCDECVKILRELSAQKNCELGAHLHPWCNPPFYAEINEADSHVVNLPIAQVEAKLIQLVSLLKDKLACQPRSFRTGRWGINGEVMQLLIKHGFKVDSSVYPYYENEYFSCHGAPELPYWPDLRDPLSTSAQREIYELPVTVGFNHSNYALANLAHQLISHPVLNWSRLVGLAWHSHLLRKTYLSPELAEVEDMLSLCKMTINKGIPVIHMFLHSSSLVDNPNSLIGNHNAFEFITQAIRKLVSSLKRDYEIEFCTISEAAAALQQRDLN